MNTFYENLKKINSMKTKFFKSKIILLLALFCYSSKTFSQCDHSPTITSPRLNFIFFDSVLFCDPSDNEILSTQTADSYQWYKKELSFDGSSTWMPILGATSQTLSINGVDDYFFYFKVATTIDGCTEESQEILIDGYAYQLPTMMTTFEPNTFEQIDDLEYNVCEGSSVVFDNNNHVLWGDMTWFKCYPNSIPPDNSDVCIIPNQNEDYYTATESGIYGFYACTEYCPNQCEFLGTSGFIKLNFGNFNFCNLNNDDIDKVDKISLYPNPVQTYLFIGKEGDYDYSKISIYDLNGKLVLEKQNHKYNEPIYVGNLSTGNFIVISTSSSNEVFRNKIIIK